MATAIMSEENYLVVELGKRHPDYRIMLIMHSPESVYPMLCVTNDDYVVNTRIFLAQNYWSVNILDRLVKKAIKQIGCTETPSYDE